MPLPTDFPKPPDLPPRRPTAAEPFTKINGTVAQSWLNYFDARDRWNAAMLEYQQAVRAYLDSQ